jgi:hypothetical protein
VSNKLQVVFAVARTFERRGIAFNVRANYLALIFQCDAY